MMFWAVGPFFCFLGSVFTKFSNNCSKNDYLLFVCGTCLGTNFGTKISCIFVISKQFVKKLQKRRFLELMRKVRNQYLLRTNRLLNL